jgi:hypothetical protein
LAYLYYWFRVGEGTFAIHHLISEITPNKHSFAHENGNKNQERKATASIPVKKT